VDYNRKNVNGKKYDPFKRAKMINQMQDRHNLDATSSR